MSWVAASSEDLIGTRDYAVTCVSMQTSKEQSPVFGILTAKSGVVWLNAGFLDLAVVCDNSVALAAVGSEQGSSRKLSIKCAGELARGIAEEADAGGLARVERLAPSIHAVKEGSGMRREMGRMRQEKRGLRTQRHR
jgi:hypothetical protein